MMFFTRSTLLLALTSTILPSALAQNQDQDQQDQSATPTFSSDLQSLLAQADRVALHAALHESHPSFADGTHENDLAAIEAIARESPPLASQILHKVQLSRRQANGTMTTSAPANNPSDTGSADSSSTEVDVTTYTPPGGVPTTITTTRVVGVHASNTGGSANGGAAATTSARGAGSLQSKGEMAAERPWENAKLMYQAMAVVMIAGWAFAA